MLVRSASSASFGVGTPPDHSSASIRPDSSAVTASTRDRCSARNASASTRPAAANSRPPNSAAPDPVAPSDTGRPARSRTEWTGLSARTTSCM